MRRGIGKGSCALLACVALLTLGGCDEDAYPAAEFIDDLYLVVEPKPAHPGDELRFFVQGEPPLRLRAKKYVDILSADDEPLYRLTAEGKAGDVSVLPYPLPGSYRPPSGTERLQTRQAVRLPRDLDPGRYVIRGALLAVRRGEEPQGGAPEARLTVIAK
jgi:hypothetical protein